MPRSGGEYVYFMESFGPLHPFWGPLPGFLYSFMIVLLVRPVEIAAIILTSADYLVEMVLNFLCLEGNNDMMMVKKLVAIALLGMFD